MTWGAGYYNYDGVWHPQVIWPKPKDRQQQRTRKQVQRKQQKTRKQTQRKQQKSRKQIKL
jgi:hypothetical protein